MMSINTGSPETTAIHEHDSQLDLYITSGGGGKREKRGGARLASIFRQNGASEAPTSVGLLVESRKKI